MRVFLVAVISSRAAWLVRYFSMMSIDVSPWYDTSTRLRRLGVETANRTALYRCIFIISLFSRGGGGGGGGGWFVLCVVY